MIITTVTEEPYKLGQITTLASVTFAASLLVPKGSLGYFAN